MSTPTPDPDYTPRRRRVWGKKLTPMEMSALFRDYDSGMSSVQLRDKYAVGKSTLYRWINEFEEREDRVQDTTFMRARITDLEHCIAMLTLKLAALEKDHDRTGDRGPVCDPDPVGSTDDRAI